MNWRLERLKTQIRGYDIAYRKGEPLVLDTIFDTLLDKLEAELSAEEYTEFRASLFETGGKVKHDFVIGSLRKTKAEDDSFTVWVNKRPNNPMLVAEKLDGVSIVLHFVDGKLFKAVTRGDSEAGEDQTDKLKLIIPELKKSFTGQLRGEILLTRKNLANINAGISIHNSPRGNPLQKNLKKEYKNPRNAVSGIIGKVDFDPDLVKQLSVRIYQILGSTANKAEQYHVLGGLGVKLPKLKVLHKPTREQLVQWYEKWTEESDYDIDGLVVYDLKGRDENQKLPNDTVAFKVNDQVDSTEYKSCEWQFSKNAIYTPVINFEPIELGGATVQRATGHNWRNVVNLKIGKGAILTIEKAGDIIPKIINVIEGDELLEIPTECVHCGTTLKTTDVDLYCPNKNCDGLGVKKVMSFLKSCGVKGFTETTLDKFGIASIEDLLNFTPHDRKKNETKLILALDDFVFNKPVEELVIHLPYTNFGTTLVKNVLKAFNNDVSALREYRDTLGQVTVEKVSEERLKVFVDQLNNYYAWVIQITSDGRWNPNEVTVEDVKASTKFEGMSFCFTGKFTTMDRKDAEGLVWQNSGEVKSVSKKLTYLVNNDITSTTGKNKKAQDLNIPIISEEEFLKLVNE